MADTEVPETETTEEGNDATPHEHRRGGEKRAGKRKVIEECCNNKKTTAKRVAGWESSAYGNGTLWAKATTSQGGRIGRHVVHGKHRGDGMALGRNHCPDIIRGTAYEGAKVDKNLKEGTVQY